MKPFRPMLAAAATEADIAAVLKRTGYLLASPKLDGVRCLIRDGVALSRSLKPIPNKHVQAVLGRLPIEGFDGELIVGSPTAKDCYRTTVSGVMSEDGYPDFQFYVFDHVDALGNDYRNRLAYTSIHINSHNEFGGTVIDHSGRNVVSINAVRAYESEMLDLGYEGVCLRDPGGPYKFGRSTLKEGYLIKLKRFTDAEATVIGFTELMHNANAATVNALGLTERSSHKANQIGMSTLGTLVCLDVATGVEFEIGTGFTQADRETFWSDRDSLLGALVKYKSFKIGEKDKPRHPVFLGFRDPGDL